VRDHPDSSGAVAEAARGQLPASLPACLPAPGHGERVWGDPYLQLGVGSVDQPIAEDGVPVLNVRAAGKKASPTSASPTAPAWGAPATAPPATHWKAKVLP